MQDTSKNASKPPKTHSLTFLGTGASCGVPSFYCGCVACADADAEPRARRDCSSLLISGAENTLIDTAPELRSQLLRERVSRVERVLYTHRHFDHLGGLPQLEFYVRLASKSPMPIYASMPTLAAIKQQFDWMSDVLEPQPLTDFESREFDGVRYTALPAAHCDGCFGFLIQTAATRLAYFPDTGPLPPQSLEQLTDLDILIIDATFNGANWMPQSHHSVDEAIALAQSLQPRQCYLSHLAMHYDTPVTVVNLEQRLAGLDLDIALAYDGLRLNI